MTSDEGPGESIRVSRAGLGDLDLVSPLFDAYRSFYGQPAYPGGVRAFLEQRMEN